MANKKQNEGRQSEKVFVGVNIDPKLKEELQEIADREHRSLNGQVEFFLSLGVQHLMRKQAA